MSKILKGILKSHRPAHAAKLTKENGYDADKHRTVADLSGIQGLFSPEDLLDMQGCVDDLADQGHNGAQAVKAAASGEIPLDKLNDDEFFKTLMAMDGEDPADADGDDDDDDDSDDDEFGVNERETA